MKRRDFLGGLAVLPFLPEGFGGLGTPGFSSVGGVNAINFDGTNDFLSRDADLDGNADGKLGVMSFWTLLQGVAGIDAIMGNASGRVKIEWDGAEKFHFFGNQVGGAAALDMETTNVYSSSDGWLHVIAAWDNGNSQGQIYVNDVSDVSITTQVDAEIEYTRTSWGIGAASNAGAQKWQGCFAEFYLNVVETLDLSVETNRRKFIAGGKPVSLGSDGSLPTGNQPIIYLRNKPQSFHKNLGSGGDFVANGALTQCSTRP